MREIRYAVAMFAACVATFLPRPASAQEMQHLGCLIDPHKQVELSTREVGTVRELLVDRGDRVQKGQIVARLDDEIEAATVDLARARAQMQAEIQEAETALEFAERQQQRVDDLYQRKAVSFREVDSVATEAARARLQLTQARQRAEVARLELNRARRFLERRALRSPIEGVVVEQMISPGESVENRPILRIAKIDPLNVEVIVPVNLFGSITNGMTADVVPQFPGADSRRATVKVVDPVVEAASNTFGVRLELANPEHAIPAGVRCELRFVRDLADQAPDAPDRSGIPPSPRSGTALENGQIPTDGDARAVAFTSPGVPAPVSE